MKKIFAVLLAAMMVLSLAACGGKTEPEVPETTLEQQDTTAEAQVSEDTTAFPEGNPAEYSREFWEEKYPGENICPFYINENGTEYSYYWISGLEGWDGTMASWINQPFNWNGWHKTEDGSIVNEDETLKISDSWVNGDESMSSFCTVTTEEYVKDTDAQSAEGEDWPIADYQKPEN